MKKMQEVSFHIEKNQLLGKANSLF